jgi:hypothetical protein
VYKPDQHNIRVPVDRTHMITFHNDIVGLIRVSPLPSARRKTEKYDQRRVNESQSKFLTEFDLCPKIDSTRCFSSTAKTT